MGGHGGRGLGVSGAVSLTIPFTRHHSPCAQSAPCHLIPLWGPLPTPFGARDTRAERHPQRWDEEVTGMGRGARPLGRFLHTGPTRVALKTFISLWEGTGV